MYENAGSEAGESFLYSSFIQVNLYNILVLFKGICIIIYGVLI